MNVGSIEQGGVLVCTMLKYIPPGLPSKRLLKPSLYYWQAVKRPIIQIFFGRNHKDKPVLTNHACTAINTIYLKTSRIFILCWKVEQYFKCCFNNFTQRKSLHLCYISNTLRYLIIEHKKISDQWNKIFWKQDWTFENKTDKIKSKVTFLVGITNISIKTNLWTLNILTPKTKGFHCFDYLTPFHC